MKIKDEKIGTVSVRRKYTFFNVVSSFIKLIHLSIVINTTEYRLFISFH